MPKAKPLFSQEGGRRGLLSAARNVAAATNVQTGPVGACENECLMLLGRN